MTQMMEQPSAEEFRVQCTAARDVIFNGKDSNNKWVS
jgi:hypothetical protein